MGGDDFGFPTGKGRGCGGGGKRACGGGGGGKRACGGGGGGKRACGGGGGGKRACGGGGGGGKRALSGTMIGCIAADETASKSQNIIQNL